MALPSIKNAAVIFAKRPEGYPIPGEHLVYEEDTNETDLNAVELDGGVLVKTLVLSIDPYLRNRMKPNGSLKLGKPLNAYGVGLVLKSDSSKYKPGDYIYTEYLSYQLYTVVPENLIMKTIENQGFPWSNYVGVLGMPGRTGYVPYKAFAKAKKGEVIYVSAGAGVVGSVVCQSAKADGLKVIASAGSEDKVAFLRSIGVDVAFNYKETPLESVLKEHGPLDIYWDNVGGRDLETALANMKDFGRIISCGSISQYNATGEPYGIKNTNQFYSKNLTINGFIINQLIAHLGQDFDFETTMSALLKEGHLKIMEDVREGLKEAPQLFLDVQQGRNTGKAVIKVADP